MVFLARSAVLPVASLITASPSSRYSPMSALSNSSDSFDREYVPTSSQSAPSKQPMVTSKSPLPSFFIHSRSPLKSRDFRECMTISLSCCVMSVYCVAKVSACPSRSSDIHCTCRWVKFCNIKYQISNIKYQISKQMNEHVDLFSNLRNHSITVVVFFHELMLSSDRTVWTILSMMLLLTRPMSLFAGLISRHSVTESSKAIIILLLLFHNHDDIVPISM